MATLRRYRTWNYPSEHLVSSAGNVSVYAVHLWVPASWRIRVIKWLHAPSETTDSAPPPTASRLQTSGTNRPIWSSKWIWPVVLITWKQLANQIRKRSHSINSAVSNRPVSSSNRHPTNWNIQSSVRISTSNPPKIPWMAFLCKVGNQIRNHLRITNFRFWVNKSTYPSLKGNMSPLWYEVEPRLRLL